MTRNSQGIADIARESENRNIYHGGTETRRKIG
jgi:hypothetical protein